MPDVDDLIKRLRNPKYTKHVVGIPTLNVDAMLADAAEAASALEALAGRQMAVKPLEWQGPFKAGENGSHYDHIFADSALGRYSFDWKGWKEFDPPTSADCPGDFFYCAHDLDEAKAAAQADYERRIRSAIVTAAPPAPQAAEGEWRNMADAPKDGTLLRLLVKPDVEAHTSFEDSEKPYQTIGFNQLRDTGDDVWQFAGWDWSHDCITQGYGEVIGWMPFTARPTQSKAEGCGYPCGYDCNGACFDTSTPPASGKVEAEAVPEYVPSDRLEEFIGIASPTTSEVHDMAVELILHRRKDATVASMHAEIERLRKAMTLAHALMRECGWQLAPAAEPQGDGVLELACAEVEETFRALLKGETE